MDPWEPTRSFRRDPGGVERRPPCGVRAALPRLPNASLPVVGPDLPGEGAAARRPGRAPRLVAALPRLRGRFSLRRTHRGHIRWARRTHHAGAPLHELRGAALARVAHARGAGQWRVRSPHRIGVTTELNARQQLEQLELTMSNA